ncbi:hypothetical protein TNCV_2009141 [Trichonephila clavipes]|nr:hypothetical protein TNCV_2009141 [Trichonephila clavipes]
MSDLSLQTFGILRTRFSMALQFLEGSTVRFRSLPGRQPRSLKRQIAPVTVCRGTFSKRTVVFFAETTLK